jgi:hypothetical protein
MRPASGPSLFKAGSLRSIRKISGGFWSIQPIIVVTLALLLIIGNGSARGEQFDLVAPMHDFVLLEPPDPPSPSGPEAYARTGLAPEWYIAQWNIPAGKLSPFSVRQPAGG